VAKILLQFDIQTSDGVASLDKIKEALESVGVSGTKVQAAMDQQEKSLQKVLNAAEPTRVATEKLAAAQQALTTAVDQGKISQDRAAAASDALKQKYADQQAGVGGLAKAYGDLQNAIAGAAAAAGVWKIADWVGGTIQLGAAADATSAKLAAMIAATGGSAGQTMAQLQAMATSLSQLTGISVESTKSAEALLMSFRSVGEQGFEPTMQAAADLAALMGTDLTSAVWMLGKALENPTLGMTNLRRAGIVLSDDEKEQIKTLQASGDMLGAQSALLQDVENRTRGLADAMGSTLQGNLNKVTNSWALLRAEEGQYWVAVVGGTGFLQNLATVLGMDADAIKTLRESGTGIQWSQGFLGIISGVVPMTDIISDLQQIAGIVEIIAGAKTPEGYTTTVPAATSKLFVGITSDDLDAAAKAVESFQAMLNAANPLIAAMSAYKTTLSDLADLETKVTVKEDERNTILEAAAAKLKAALVANKAYADELAYEAKTISLTTTDSFFDQVFQSEAAASTTLNGAITSTWGDAGTFASEAFLTHFDSAFGMSAPANLDPLALHAGQDFGNAMGTGVIGGIVGGAGGVAIKEGASQVAKDFQRSFTSTLTDVFSGDFTKAWTDLWKGLAKISADTVSTTLFGGKDSQGKEVSGIFSSSDTSTTPTQDALVGGGALVGGYLSGQAYSNSNQAEGALGGAISGAATGLEVGGPYAIIAAIIGAVVGGVMGYFATAGAKSTDYNIYAGTTGSTVKYSGALGPDYPTQALETKQLQDKINTTVASMRDLLSTMGAAFVNPTIGFSFSGSSKDPSQAFDLILKQLLPQDIFKAYTPAILAGMTTGTAATGTTAAVSGLGISSGRAADEIARVVNSADFDTALAKLQTYIQAVVDLKTLHTELATSFVDLKTQLLMDTRAAWQASMTDTLTQISKLSENLDSLTSDEQVSRAQQIKDLTETQYENNLKYLQQILETQKTMDQQFTDMFAGFDEQTAKNQGTDALAAYYETQLQKLSDQLKLATSPEAVSTITTQMQKYGTALWNMNYQGDLNGGGTQAWVTEFLKQQQTAADAMLNQWSKDTAAANQLLSDALANITNALNAQVGATANATAASLDETTARTNLIAVLGDETDAHNALVDACNAAADAMTGIASAAAAATPVFVRSA
jgi:hypothetical protein